MPTITVGDREIECEEGATLRDVLLRAGESPHNARANVFNCRGFGSCGTCAVDVTGEVGDRGLRERTRLSIPPHDPDSGLRLACQVRVESDLSVEKHPGFWGQHTDREEDGTEEP